MSDRIFFKANFSNVTTSASSGAREIDEEGKELARIPVQLPTNIISHANPPKGMEMLVSKMDIPLSEVPINHIPILEFRRQSSASMGIWYQILSKGCMTIWPFFTSHGNVYPEKYKPPIFQSSNNRALRTEYSQISLRGVIGESSYDAKIKNLQKNMDYDFESIDSVCDFLSYNFRNILNWNLYSQRPTWWRADYFYPRFMVSENHLVLQMRNFGCKYPVTLYHPDLFSEILMSHNPLPTVFRCVNETGEETQTSMNIYGFSLVVNKHIKNLLPNLPWIQIDNSKLPQFRWDDTAQEYVGQSIYQWEHMNFNDPIFYVLDTSKATLIQKQEDVRTGEVLSSTFEYHFEGFDLISMINISSFIVVLDGISFVQQTFPVDISPANSESAQLSSIPIIENYIPYWQNINDLSTNLVITREAFSNAAPIVLDRGALYERNLRFSVYYITKDAKMHLLRIAPGSVLSIQLSFALIF